MVIAGLKSLRHKFNRTTCVVTMIVAVLAVFAFSAFAQIKTITINADGQTLTVKTSAKTVEKVLMQNDISLGENDEITPPITSETDKNMTITVKRAFDVPVVLGTDSFTLKTVSKTLDELLKSEGIVLGEYDIVNPSLDTVLTEGSTVNITRVFVGEVIEKETIPYTKKTVPNNSLESGDTKVKTPGENGEKELVYKITVTNGEETERVLVDERITKEAVTEIVEYGTKASGGVTSGVVANSAQVFAGCKYLDVKAYSYIIHGRTATGMKTQRGIIAVDPRVIPLGTKVYVQSLDGKPDYGYALAADVGGGIKGNKIDLWVPTYAEACQNGVRNMRVYILS